MIREPRHSKYRPLITASVQTTVYAIVFACSLTGPFYQDVIGRRIALIVGAGIMACCMMGFAGLLTAIPNPVGASSNACIALSQ